MRTSNRNPMADGYTKAAAAAKAGAASASKAVTVIDGTDDDPLRRRTRLRKAK